METRDRAQSVEAWGAWPVGGAAVVEKDGGQNVERQLAGLSSLESSTRRGVWARAAAAIREGVGEGQQQATDRDALSPMPLPWVNTPQPSTCCSKRSNFWNRAVCQNSRSLHCACFHFVKKHVHR